MSKNLVITYDDNGYYLINSSFMIITEESDDYNKSLSTVLSSTTMDFYMKLLADVLRGKTLSIKTHYLNKLPIIELTQDSQEKLVKLHDKITTLNQQLRNTNTPTERKLLQKQIEHTDKKINELVYELYDLTEEEIKIIELTYNFYKNFSVAGISFINKKVCNEKSIKMSLFILFFFSLLVNIFSNFFLSWCILFFQFFIFSLLYHFDIISCICNG